MVNEVTRHFIDTPGLSLIVYGVILVLIISFLPNGLMGLFKSRLKKKGGDESARKLAGKAGGKSDA
jgi:hypothetical protein